MLTAGLTHWGHKAHLMTEARQSKAWGVDVREATADRPSYYHRDGSEFALWCPEDIYIEEPIDLIQAYLTAGRLHRACCLRHRRRTA